MGNLSKVFYQFFGIVILLILSMLPTYASDVGFSLYAGTCPSLLTGENPPLVIDPALSAEAHNATIVNHAALYASLTDVRGIVALISRLDLNGGRSEAVQNIIINYLETPVVSHHMSGAEFRTLISILIVNTTKDEFPHRSIELFVAENLMRLPADELMKILQMTTHAWFISTYALSFLDKRAEDLSYQEVYTLVRGFQGHSRLDYEMIATRIHRFLNRPLTRNGIAQTKTMRDILRLSQVQYLEMKASEFSQTALTL